MAPLGSVVVGAKRALKKKKRPRPPVRFITLWVQIQGTLGLHVDVRTVLMFPSREDRNGGLLRGTIVNRTYGIHKNLHIYLFPYQQYLVLFTMVPRNRISRSDCAR